MVWLIDDQIDPLLCLKKVSLKFDFSVKNHNFLIIFIVTVFTK